MLAQRARGNPANIELRSFSPVFLGLLGMVATQFHARGTLIGNVADANILLLTELIFCRNGGT